MTANLRVVPKVTLADQLSHEIAEYDRLRFDLQKQEALIRELGRMYIAEKYPDAREFMSPGIQRLKAELDD